MSDGFPGKRQVLGGEATGLGQWPARTLTHCWSDAASGSPGISTGMSWPGRWYAVMAAIRTSCAEGPSTLGNAVMRPRGALVLRPFAIERAFTFHKPARMAVGLVRQVRGVEGGRRALFEGGLGLFGG